MTLRKVGFGAIAILYVGAGTLFVGFHHLPHGLDVFYGSAVLAPVAIVCGALALNWRLAIPLYFVLFAEVFILAAALSAPASPAYLYLIGFVISSAINAAPASLFYLLGRALRPKLIEAWEGPLV